MGVINVRWEEFGEGIEEMFDLGSKGENVVIDEEGKRYSVIGISDEELEKLGEKEKGLVNK